MPCSPPPTHTPFFLCVLNAAGTVLASRTALPHALGSTKRSPALSPRAPGKGRSAEAQREPWDRKPKNTLPGSLERGRRGSRSLPGKTQAEGRAPGAHGPACTLPSLSVRPGGGDGAAAGRHAGSSVKQTLPREPQGPLGGAHAALPPQAHPGSKGKTSTL